MSKDIDVSIEFTENDNKREYLSMTVVFGEEFIVVLGEPKNKVSWGEIVGDMNLQADLQDRLEGIDERVLAIENAAVKDVPVEDVIAELNRQDEGSQEYIRLFDTPANADGYKVTSVPFLALVKSTGQLLTAKIKIFYGLSENEVVEILPNNMIKYASAMKIVPKVTAFGEVNYVPSDSTFDRGEGFMAFDGDVVTIPDGAFTALQLTSMVLPDSVTTIGKAFNDITTDIALTIKESVVSIDGAFINSNNATITINKLQKTYTSAIFGPPSSTPSSATTLAYNVYINSVEEDYGDTLDTGVLFGQGVSKVTITYNVFTDNEYVKTKIAAKANSYTIFNMYHLDGSSWS